MSEETPQALREQGNAFFREQKYFDAERCYNSAIEKTDPNDKEILSILYTNLSNAQCHIEKVTEAIDSAAKAIELNDKNPKAYLRRGDARIKALNLTEAYNDFVQACKLQPSVQYYRDRATTVKKQIDADTIRRSFAFDHKPTPPPRPVTPANESHEEPVFDRDFAIKLMSNLTKFVKPPVHTVNVMLDRMTELNKVLPNIVDLTIAKQIRIVGDVHGQYQDLVQIFDNYGYPSSENPYLFNGDFVDRGSMGLEILLTLFAWKLADPNSIFMNRGNHESTAMNSMYGFENECSFKYSKAMYTSFSTFFNYLPLGHIINKRILVVHGGLFSNQNVTLADIQKANRFDQPPSDGPLNDILWADPMEQNGILPSPRGVTSTFGPDVTEKFLSQNNLELLVRSHQVQENGYLEMHRGKCVTVFSSPNYIGQMHNLGATMKIEFNEDGSIKNKTYDTFKDRPYPPEYPPMRFAAFNF